MFKVHYIRDEIKRKVSRYSLTSIHKPASPKLRILQQVLRKENDLMLIVRSPKSLPLIKRKEKYLQNPIKAKQSITAAMTMRASLL